MSEWLVILILAIAVGCGSPEPSITHTNAPGATLPSPSPLPPTQLTKCLLQGKRRPCRKGTRRYLCYTGLDANGNGLLELPVEALSVNQVCVKR